MSIYRFFTDEGLLKDSEVSIKDKEYHHLIHVLRLKMGEKVELVNGRGQLAQGLLTAFSKQYAKVFIEKVFEEPPPSFFVILLQAIPRSSRLDTIVEKGTELGMTHLWLFPGDLSEKKKLSANEIHRLELKATAAMKQCDRLYLPTIEIKPSLKKWDKPKIPLFFGDLEKKAPLLLDSCKQDPPLESIIFAIGPESGFSQEELSIFKNWQGVGIRLHRNILRTDTAALVALSLIEQLR